MADGTGALGRRGALLCAWAVLLTLLCGRAVRAQGAVPLYYSYDAGCSVCAEVHAEVLDPPAEGGVALPGGPARSAEGSAPSPAPTEPGHCQECEDLHRLAAEARLTVAAKTGTPGPQVSPTATPVPSPTAGGVTDQAPLVGWPWSLGEALAMFVLVTAVLLAAWFVRRARRA